MSEKEYLDENQNAITENEQILIELESLREDLNILATYIRMEQNKQAERTKSLDEDFKSLEKAIEKKIKEILGSITTDNAKSDTTYIKNLLSDDFKDMQTSLLNQVKELVFNSNGGKK